MAWFSSLFKKKGGMETVYIELSELPSWFDDKTEPLIDNIKDDIKIKLDEIKANCDKAKENLNMLSQAKLMNENIPERAMSVMKGNRDSYINAVNLFLNQTKVPTAINIGSISDFLARFEESLNTFTKTSARNYYVLQEFFRQESGAVAQNIKNIDMLSRSLLDNEYKEVNDVRTKIEKIENFIELKKKASGVLEEEKANLSSISASKKEIEDKIGKIKQSRDFRELKELEDEKKEIHSGTKKNDQELSMLFSPIDKSMKKYSKISLEDGKLIDEYLDSPIKGLLNDRSMRIMNVLAKIRELAEAGQLDLNSKKKEKTLEALNQLTRERIVQYAAKHRDLLDSMDKLKKRESINTASQKLNELNYKLTHIDDQILRSELYIEKMSKQIGKFDLAKIVSEIEVDVKGLLGVRLRVKIQGIDNSAKEEEKEDEDEAA
ncbi:MAG: hypothetical protein NT001_03540 [Candidatus Woesearchaeota archaeon]|nr:hypothetical protein [Candidatus Woesearchaeota archaeon]